MSENSDVFTLGLTMAGAVSAGAYTAGVVDCLFRAIDAHNARVAKGITEDDPDPPRHRVVVKVISGASAGSICAGLAVAGLIKHQRPGEARLSDPKTLTYDGLDADGQPKRMSCPYVFDSQFDAWVKLIDLWHTNVEQGLPVRENGGLLGTKDLAQSGSNSVRSIFNSNHINDVAFHGLDDITWGHDGHQGIPYDFIARKLDVFLTTTSLSGVPYKVDFAGERSEGSDLGGYYMAQHSIVRHFRVSELGSYQIESPWLDAWSDHGIGLDLPQAPKEKVPFNTPNTPWNALKVSAIASGAFPIGLAPRRIDATAGELGVLDQENKAKGGAIPIDVDLSKARVARPNFGDGIASADTISYVSVDGGVANNEPFEYARFTLRRKDPSESGALLPNCRDATKADRAVIMIDPFPEGPEYEPSKKEEITDLLGMVPSALRLFPTLIEQARFKPAELVNAFDPEIRSRFMIAPRRSKTRTHQRKSGTNAIACGAFSGFSGFLDESFRRHDFVLGQRNCQRFLERHFTLSAANPVLALGDDHAAVRQARAAGENDRVCERQVIDPGPEFFQSKIALPVWPQIDNDRLRPMLEQAKKRLGELGSRLVSLPSLGFWLRNFLRIVWSGIGFGHGVQGKVADAVTRTVLSTMILRDQHTDYNGLSKGERLVVLKLIAAKDEAKTVEELLKGVRNDPSTAGVEIPSEDRVNGLLETLKAKGLVKRPWTNLFGKPRYTHLPS